MKAIHNKIIVRPDEVKKVTKSGIILPIDNRGLYIDADVISAGHKVEGVEPGDRIRLEKNAMVNLEDVDKEWNGLCLIRDIDAIGVIIS